MYSRWGVGGGGGGGEEGGGGGGRGGGGGMSCLAYCVENFL